MEVAIWIIIAAYGIFSFLIGVLVGYFVREIKPKEDDGVVILNNERVEVIFKDDYETLSKRRYVNLKMQS